jgi:hypothetical protein
MHFRSKELKIRSAFPVYEVGKSVRDTFNNDRISLSQLYLGEQACTLTYTLISYGQSPLDITIVNQFMNACNESERMFAEGKLAGYSEAEIMQLMGLQRPQFERLKLTVRENAVEYLV